MRDRVRKRPSQPMLRLLTLLGAAGAALVLPEWLLAQETIQIPMYGEEFPFVGSRVAVRTRSSAPTEPEPLPPSRPPYPVELMHPPSEP